jgi:hypothetical protein
MQRERGCRTLYPDSSNHIRRESKKVETRNDRDAHTIIERKFKVQ